MKLNLASKRIYSDAVAAEQIAKAHQIDRDFPAPKPMTDVEAALKAALEAEKAWGDLQTIRRARALGYA